MYDRPILQGRGEFVRLALEEAGADYVDVARKPVEDGRVLSALTRLLEDPDNPRPAFVPLFLRDRAAVVGQTAAILFDLGPRLGHVPEAEEDRIWTHQVQLTIADMVAEVHDTHHPIAVSLADAEQRTEAVRRAAHVRTDRIPELVAWFEHVSTRDGGTCLVGNGLS